MEVMTSKEGNLAVEEGTRDRKKPVAKPTKYHYYPHNQHLYLLPECATQQVRLISFPLNYKKPWIEYNLAIMQDVLTYCIPHHAEGDLIKIRNYSLTFLYSTNGMFVGWLITVASQGTLFLHWTGTRCYLWKWTNKKMKCKFTIRRKEKKSQGKTWDLTTRADIPAVPSECE